MGKARRTRPGSKTVAVVNSMVHRPHSSMTLFCPNQAPSSGVKKGRESVCACMLVVLRNNMNIIGRAATLGWCPKFIYTFAA